MGPVILVTVKVNIAVTPNGFATVAFAARFDTLALIMGLKLTPTTFDPPLIVTSFLVASVVILPPPYAETLKMASESIMWSEG